MKFVLLLAAGVVLGLFTRSDATSPMKCPDQCDRSTCPPVNCRCGSYKDECFCCDICFKCPRETCARYANDRCYEDRPCQIPNGLSGVDAYNAEGVCP